MVTVINLEALVSTGGKINQEHNSEITVVPDFMSLKYLFSISYILLGL